MVHIIYGSDSGCYIYLLAKITEKGKRRPPRERKMEFGATCWCSARVSNQWGLKSLVEYTADNKYWMVAELK